MTTTLPKATTEAVGIERAPVRTFTALGTADDVQINGQLYRAERVMRALEAHDGLVKALEDIVGWRPEERATVDYRNALEEFSKANGVLCAIFDIADRAISKAKGG